MKTIKRSLCLLLAVLLLAALPLPAALADAGIDPECVIVGLKNLYKDITILLTNKFGDIFV